jgi:hypothetical protein
MAARVNTPFQVSLSAMGMFLNCERAYHYRYIEGLSKREKEVSPERGIIFHDAYMETFYGRLHDVAVAVARGKRKVGATEDDAITAHMDALAAVERTRSTCDSYSELCRMGGDDEDARAFAELPDVVRRIAERYFLVRGVKDALEVEPIIVEQPIAVLLGRGTIKSVGRIDMVTRHKETGRVALWEHKTVEHVPPNAIRVANLQTLKYAAMLRVQGPMIEKLTDGLVLAQASDGWSVDGLVVDEVQWNYLRMKEPTRVEPLKTGKLTQAKDIDTTWEVYAVAVAQIGDDPLSDTYKVMRERLVGREESAFFPRFTKDIVVDSQRVLHDYAVIAQRMKERVAAWGEGEAPVRTGLLAGGTRCQWCAYAPLTMAVLTGGEGADEELIKMKYKRRGQK